MLASDGVTIKLCFCENEAQDGGMMLEDLRPTWILGPGPETAEYWSAAGGSEAVWAVGFKTFQ